jgi:hypothetical protein
MPNPWAARLRVWFIRPGSRSSKASAKPGNLLAGKSSSTPIDNKLGGGFVVPNIRTAEDPARDDLEIRVWSQGNAFGHEVSSQDRPCCDPDTPRRAVLEWLSGSTQGRQPLAQRREIIVHPDGQDPSVGDRQHVDGVDLHDHLPADHTIPIWPADP